MAKSVFFPACTREHAWEPHLEHQRGPSQQPRGLARGCVEGRTHAEAFLPALEGWDMDDLEDAMLGHKFPAPLVVVRNSFIEVLLLDPLQERFSKLRRARSCSVNQLYGSGTAGLMVLSAAWPESPSPTVASGGEEDGEGEESDDDPELLGQLSLEAEELTRLSVGSGKHGSRRCKPCAFFHSEGGCSNGSACLFCHACEPGEKRRRQKEKWQRRRRLWRGRAAAQATAGALSPMRQPRQRSAAA